MQDALHRVLLKTKEQILHITSVLYLLLGSPNVLSLADVPPKQLICFPDILRQTFQSLVPQFLRHPIKGFGNAAGDAGSQGSATFIQAMVELPPMFGFALLLKKFRVDTLMVFSAIAWCVKDILILIAPNMAVYYFAMVFQMFSYAIIIPASVYLVDEYIASEDRNQGQAVMGAAGTIGGLFASFIGGFLLSLLSVRATLYVGIAVAVVGVLFMLIGMKKLKKA